MIHPLVYLLIARAIVGVILWGIQRIPGLPPIISVVITVVVVVIALVWLLEQFQAGAFAFQVPK